jgi:hypothetical protein
MAVPCIEKEVPMIAGSNTPRRGRVAALTAFAFIASVAWIPSADAGFIYEAQGVITGTSGEFPPSDGQFSFSAGDVFDATLLYTPETATDACGGAGACACFNDFLSYEIRIGPDRINSGSVSGCLENTSVIDDWPGTTFTPEGLWAEELSWGIGMSNELHLPSSDDFLASLIGSSWYIFFLAYEGDVRKVDGEVYSATRIPEPATLALVLGGFLVLGIGRLARGRD